MIPVFLPFSGSAGGCDIGSGVGSDTAAGSGVGSAATFFATFVRKCGKTQCGFIF